MRRESAAGVAVTPTPLNAIATRDTAAVTRLDFREKHGPSDPWLQGSLFELRVEGRQNAIVHLPDHRVERIEHLLKVGEV